MFMFSKWKKVISSDPFRYGLATGPKTFTYRGAKLYNGIAKDMRHGKS